MYSQSFMDELEGFLTEKKLTDVLFDDMEPYPAPGMDGFTVKFIGSICDILAPIITLAVNEVKNVLN